MAVTVRPRFQLTQNPNRLTIGGRGMTSTNLLARLTARGIMLRAVDDRIQAKPMSSLLPDEREQLQQFKAELLTLLRVDGPATQQPDQLDEFLEERAGIREFDGGLSRADAEYLAARDCSRGQTACD